MKLTTVLAEGELSDEEVSKALKLYAKSKSGVLLEAANLYLKSQGYIAKKIAHSEDSEGRITIKAQIESIKSEIEKTLFVSPNAPADKASNAGFQRKNVGFYQILMEYLTDEKKKGNKEIPFDQVYDDMKFFLPDLKRRNCYIYLSDRRQQKSKGYIFNTKKKTLSLAR